MTDHVTLTDYEARRLLNAIVKEFVQMTAEELEQQVNEGNRYRRPFITSWYPWKDCLPVAGEYERQMLVIRNDEGE